MTQRLALLQTQLPPAQSRRRVGIIGFGKVGAFLCEQILKEQSSERSTMELAFVCDPVNAEAIRSTKQIPDRCKLTSLDENFERFGADLIVEVAHPIVSKKYGARILKSADYIIASTTAFADPETEKSLRSAAEKSTGRGIYLTVGALFGAMDIKKMSDAGQLRRLEVMMAKHPLSLYPEKGTQQFDLNEKAAKASQPVELYRGPIRQLAHICPRNVNTLCTAAIAGLKTTGMDGTVGVLIADASLKDMVITLKAEGPAKPDGSPGLRLTVVRENPSQPGEVTGMATLHSFFASVKRVASSPPMGDGVHLA